MTRWLLGPLVAVLLLAGCGGRDADQQSDTQTQSKSPVQQTVSPDPAPAAAEMPAATPAAAPAATPTAVAAAQPETDFKDIDLSALPFKLQIKISAAREAARSAPNDPDKLRYLGAFYHAHGLPEGVLDCIPRALKLAPDDIGLHYLLARAYDKLDRKAEAVAAYEQMLAVQQEFLKTNPDVPQHLYAPAQLRLAELYIEKDPARAAELYRDVLKAEPRNSVAHAGLGWCALAQENYDEADQHFRRALILNPTYGPGHAGIARVFRAKGEAEAADWHEQQSGGLTRLWPMEDPVELNIMREGLNPEVLMNDAAVALQQGKPAEAEKLLTVASDFDYSGTRARNMLAMLWLETGRADQAERAFRQLLDEHPEFLAAKINLALTAIRKHDLPEAEKLLRELIEAEPDNIRALSTLSDVLDAQGKLAEIKPLLDLARDHAPEDAGIQHGVGMLLLRLKKTDEARAAFERAIALRPEFAAAHHQLGLLLRQSGDTEAARAQWTAALKAAPDYVPARYALVGLLESERRYPELVTLLREGVELQPDAAELKNALAWFLATSPDANVRSGVDAVQLAEQANQHTNFSSAPMLDTLAAAYAEAGRFEDAQTRIAQAIQIAQAAGAPQNIIEAYQQRQARYAQSQPYHEP